VADVGVADTNIAAITEAADVGLGTFYNYFTSKEAIVGAVAERMAGELTDQVVELAMDNDDGAMALGRTVAYLMAWFEQDPARAGFLIQVGLSNETLRDTLGLAIGVQVDRGRASGIFDADPLPAAASVGGILLTMFDVRRKGLLDRRSAATAAIDHALRVVGMGPQEATDLAVMIAEQGTAGDLSAGSHAV
jgi:AcrR family transcriptional regulator